MSSTLPPQTLHTKQYSFLAYKLSSEQHPQIRSFNELLQFLISTRTAASRIFARQDFNIIRKPKFLSLDAAINKYSTLQNTISPTKSFDFYTDVFEHIFNWAVDPIHTQATFPLLKNSHSQSLSIGQETARCFLANTFLCNLVQPVLDQAESKPDIGSIDLWDLFDADYGTEGRERIICLISYFHQMAQCGPANDNRVITFENLSLPLNQSSFQWIFSTKPITNVSIVESRMEDSAAPNFVDFANKHLHIHRIIASCTQEEVLFSCAPELFLAILFCETILDGQVIIMRGVRRFVDYEGYMDSFAYKGPYTAGSGGVASGGGAPSIFNVLAMDAVYSRHFSKASVDRDLNKAFLAYKAVVDASGTELDQLDNNNNAVVTGHWGCGIFGGDKMHKFLQQICAASEAGLSRLDYSVFHDPPLAISFRAALEKISQLRLTVGDLYRQILEYNNGNSGDDNDSGMIIDD